MSDTLFDLINPAPDPDADRVFARQPPSPVYQDTSREAFAAIRPALTGVNRQIVDVIRHFGGATSEQVEVCTGLQHQTVSAQIRHLRDGRTPTLRDSGRTRRNSRGRACIVWETTEGRA